MPYSYDRKLGIFYMQYHINMITYGEPVVSTGGDKLLKFWQYSTFLKQKDPARLEPERSAWQMETLTSMLFPCPPDMEGKMSEKHAFTIGRIGI